jgi:hypothetical protein
MPWIVPARRPEVELILLLAGMTGANPPLTDEELVERVHHDRG